MKKLNSKFALLLEVINPGFGFMYCYGIKPKYVLLSAIGILLIIVLMFFKVEKYEIWDFFARAPFFMLGLHKTKIYSTKVSNITFWIILFLCSRIPVKHLLKQIKEDEKIDSKKYNSVRLKTELNNLDLLKQAELLSQDDYNNKVNQIIENIKTFGLNENRETFFINILPLKEKGILTKEILNQLKE